MFFPLVPFRSVLFFSSLFFVKSGRQIHIRAGGDFCILSARVSHGFLWSLRGWTVGVCAAGSCKKTNEGSPADFPAYSLILALWIQTGSTRKIWVTHNIGEEKYLQLHNTLVSEGKVYVTRLVRHALMVPGGTTTRKNSSEADIVWNVFVKYVGETIWWPARVATSSEWCNKSKTGTLSGSCHWSHIHTWIIYTVLDGAQLSIPESLFIEHLIMAIYSSFTSHTLVFFVPVSLSWFCSPYL